MLSNACSIGGPTARVAAAAFWLAAIVAMLASCQTSEPQDVLDVQPAALEETADDMSEERFGSGKIEIALLLPRSAQGALREDAAEYRDGAALAVKNLGAEHITLTLYDTAGEASTAGARAREALAAGARLLIGPITAEELSGLSQIPVSARPPVISLVANTAAADKGILAFISDEVDSAVEVSAYAVAAGKTKIVAIVDADFPATSSARLKSGIEKRNGNLLGIIKVGSAEDVADSTGSLSKAEAVLVLSPPDLPTPVLATLRASDVLSPDVMILGTTGWTSQDIKDPRLSGAYLPVLEQGGLKEIGERMRAAYGRPMSTESAYGYDAVALAAGIARVLGEQGFSAETLHQKSGFKGATGAFRFEADGSVVRLFSIYRIVSGSLRLVDPAPAGF